MHTPTSSWPGGIGLGDFGAIICGCVGWVTAQRIRPDDAQVAAVIGPGSCLFTDPNGWYQGAVNSMHPLCTASAKRWGLFIATALAVTAACGDSGSDGGLGPVIGSITVDGELIEIRSAVVNYTSDEADPRLRTFTFAATPYSGASCADQETIGWFLRLPEEAHELPIFVGEFSTDNSFFPLIYSATAKCTDKCGVDFASPDYSTSNNDGLCTLEPTLSALSSADGVEVDQIRLKCPTTVVEDGMPTITMVDIPLTVCHS